MTVLLCESAGAVLFSGRCSRRRVEQGMIHQPRRPTGLGAEYTMFRDESETPNDMYVDPRGCHYLLRPEAIESVYYMSAHAP